MLVGTLLVDRRRSGHAEGDDDRATVLLNHVHRATAKSLKPGTVREMTVKDSPKPEQLSSSARADAPMSKRANIVSTTPIRSSLTVLGVCFFLATALDLFALTV